MLIARQISMAFCGLLVCATTVDVSYGQGGGGGRGQQTRTRFELATLPEVQADLKLNDEQKKLAADQLAKQREKRAAMAPAGGAGGGGRSDWASGQAELTKMNMELDATFVGKLDDAQKSRMNGLIAQVNGASAVMDPAIAKSLGITEEQMGKLKSANDANRAARREAMQGARDLKPEELQAATAKLAASESKSMMGLLTEAQIKSLETLKGAALTIDQTPLRPTRGNRS